MKDDRCRMTDVGELDKRRFVSKNLEEVNNGCPCHFERRSLSAVAEEIFAPELRFPDLSCRRGDKAKPS
jgi:hypothetical protein